MDFLKTRNGKIAAAVIVVVLVAIAGYLIYKRMKKENFDAGFYGYSDSPSYNDSGVLAGMGGDMYSPLGYDNQDGSAKNITQGDYYTY